MGMHKNHNAFGKALLEVGSAGEAYGKVYPKAGSGTRKVMASRLLSLPNVKEHILSLMQKDPNLNPFSLTSKLGTLTNSQNEGISLEAVKTGLKSYGVFDQSVVDNSVNSINITFSDPAGDPVEGFKHSSQASQPEANKKLDIHSANSDASDKRG